MKATYDKNPENKTPQVISYNIMRRLIGILGISLPFILIAGSASYGQCSEIQSSMSHYYYTNMRDIMVGAICAVALFLYSYKGYDRRDDIATNLAGIFALGIAFFPTSVDTTELSSCIKFTADLKLVSYIHFTCAGLFLATLAYISYFLFTITKEPVLHKEKHLRKITRNTIFKSCGIIMLACILLIALYAAFLESELPALEKMHTVFWLETIAFIAFGISWLTKGKVIMDDLNKVELDKEKIA